ncbi:carbohydrate ABC transporter permease [Jeotgalibacillus soli]|nr:carbohydrate ABC transporter permease [Jeotgalibacillus soli]
MIKKNIGSILQHIVIIVATIIFIFPIYWMVATSFKKQTDAFTIIPQWSFTATLDNYRAILFDSGFLQLLFNSLIVGVVSTVIVLILGITIAYPFARYKLSGGKQIITWVITLRIIPPIVTILPLYLLFANLGLVDTFLAFILMHVFFNLPLATLLLYGFFKDIPGELEESALVDGCNRFTAFFRVIFPIIRPGLVSAGLLSFIFSWNEFLFANILSGPNVKTAPVGLNEFSTPVGILWGQIAAAGVLIVIPVAIIAIIVQRHMIRGLTMGAVKG